jgi:hypothetical protein
MDNSWRTEIFERGAATGPSFQGSGYFRFQARLIAGNLFKISIFAFQKALAVARRYFRYTQEGSSAHSSSASLHSIQYS